MLSKLLGARYILLKLAVLAVFASFISSCGLSNSSETSPRQISANNLSQSQTASSANSVQGLDTAQAKHSVVSAARPSLLGLNSFAVAPIKIASPQVSKQVSNNDLIKIQDELISIFKSATNSEYVALAQVKGIAANELASADLAKLLNIAKKQNMDALIIVDLQRYLKSSGSSIGTNQNAEFGVGLKILDVNTSRIAWEGNYNEQDKAAPLLSVSEGHLRRPEFRSVDTLIKEGFSKLAADFSEARLKAYLNK